MSINRRCTRVADRGGITLLTVVGAVAFTILAWIDPEITADGWDMARVCLGVLLLSIGFCVKSYLGTALLGATMLPDWAFLVYVVSTLGFALASGIFCSFAD